MNLVPDVVLQTVEEITPEWMQARGLKGLLLDLDNTLTSYHIFTAQTAVITWLSNMREQGYQLIVFSNAHEDRVSPFCQSYQLGYIHTERKPSRKQYKRAITKLGLQPHEVAMVGDQIFTDVWGGNRSGLTTVLVNPVTRTWYYDLRRNIIERPFIQASLKASQIK